MFKTLFTGLLLLVLSAPAYAETLTQVSFTVNNLWILIASGLVFIMHLGFASLESGLTRSKNTVNILFKNVGVLSIGILSFALVGFNLMYPGDAFAGQLFGFGGFGIGTGPEGLTPDYNPGYTYWTDFIFQAMFAATTATIVSGAVAERMKLSAFLMFSTVLVGIGYPAMGMWKWGGGFLDKLAVPFYDFAGSTIVHSVGGWAALLAAIYLGPRLGKFEDGKIYHIKPHNFAMVTIGVFLLWFGWFGFNGGSVLSADPAAVSLVFVTTALSAAAGTMSAMIISWFVSKRPDLAMTLNGTLGGLVGITAGADQMSPMDAIIIGVIAGALIVGFVQFFDRLRIDDPVGAISVHMVCGIWGTLAVGLFGGLASTGQLVSQFIGVGMFAGGAIAFSGISLFIIQKIVGLRVSEECERQGLDISEHQEVSYLLDTTGPELDIHLPFTDE